jgi:PPOX class probable F420-dependent enzyme
MSAEVNPFGAFEGQKYLSLETFRKSGEGVRTPIWFAAQNDGPPLLYIYTIADTGKVKRIRNNPQVRIAPCDMRGNVTGEWVSARAEILSGDAAARGMQSLNRKYFPLKQVMGFFSRFSRRERLVMALRPALGV